MSDIKTDGFKASEILAQLSESFAKQSDAEKQAAIKKTNGIFQFNLKSSSGQEGIWTIDLKKTGSVYKGAAKPKADVTLIMADDTLVQIAEGKLDGQKAYMTGKLKTKGNMMLATKLGAVLGSAKGKGKAKL